MQHKVTNIFESKYVKIETFCGAISSYLYFWNKKKQENELTDSAKYNYKSGRNCSANIWFVKDHHVSGLKPLVFKWYPVTDTDTNTLLKIHTDTDTLDLYRYQYQILIP